MNADPRISPTDPRNPHADPRTRAEASDYRETSTFDDVRAFLEALVRQKAPLVLSTLAVSAEGRAIPMAVAGRDLPADGAEARRQGRPVVYLQANIHAGEVEGKEALQMLLRDLSRHDPKKLLDKLVLVVVPIYNADGNERWGDVRRNRSHQDGPARVGERANGQGLDLNRDCVKAESPEMRGVLREVYGTWDPDLVMDLHTTNGTRHGFHLTYAPPTHPNTDPALMAYNRDRLLPELRARMRRDHGWEFFDYGNTERRDGETVWATFGEEGRYVTNYAGLRGCGAILSEAVSFLPFRFRVESTLAFVRATLEAVARDPERLRRAREAARRSRPKELGVRFALDRRGVEPVPLEKPRPAAEIDQAKAPTEFVVERLPICDRWKVVRSAAVPDAWIVPRGQAAVVALLRRHGVVVERVDAPWRGPVDRFRIDGRMQAAPFQRHRLNRLEGRWEGGTADVPAGDFRVPFDQPLGRLAFHLLEPEGLDGVAAWNLMDDALRPRETYPIVKTPRRG